MFSRDTLTLSSEISFIESYPVINVIKGTHPYILGTKNIEIDKIG